MNRYILSRKRGRHSIMNDVVENSAGSNINEEMAPPQINLLPVFFTDQTVMLKIIIVTPTNSYH